MTSGPKTRRSPRKSRRSQMLVRARSRIDRWLNHQLPERVRAHLEETSDAQNEFGYDPFGFHPSYIRYVYPLVRFIHRMYFRTEAIGIEKVPANGRVLLIANHSGQLPIDGMLIGASLLLDRDPPRLVRSMVERWVTTLPFVSYIFPRLGQIVGTPDNCRALLAREEAILVFPEGVRGVNKTFDRRYQLQGFGNGFMRLALETNTPIVPVGVVGGEEQIISLYNAEELGRVLGAPALPVGPGLLFGPLGMVTPMPVKYRIYFGEPMRFTGQPDDEDRVIAAKVDQVKDAIDGLIKRGLEERKGIFT